MDVANLKNNLKNNLKVEVTGDVFPLIVTLDGHEFVVDENGNVLIRQSREGLNIGDYIDYKPDSTSQATYSKDKLTNSYTGHTGNSENINQNTLNWQILKIYDNGSMDLIGSPTEQKIYFKGAIGINNGVYIMEDICKTLYSRKGIEARSVKIEDIELYLTDEGKKAKADSISSDMSSLSIGRFISNIDTENDTVTFAKSRAYYPMIYKEELYNRIGRSDKYYTANTLITEDGKGNSYEQGESLTLPYTAYNIYINKTNYGDEYKILNSNKSFWIATRSYYCNESSGLFGFYIGGVNISTSLILDSSPYGYGNTSYRLRPVVTLGPSAQITESATATDSTTPHIITAY